jgi:hypothetical protein
MDSYLAKNNIENLQKYLSIVLAVFAIALSFSYIYLVNSSVLNTVTREQNNKDISQLVIKISTLENSYMAKKSDLNIDKAYSLGFKDDFSKVHFSSENKNIGGNLSLLGNEI